MYKSVSGFFSSQLCFYGKCIFTYLSQKKYKLGGCENMEISWVWKKKHMEIPGINQNQKRSEVSRGDQEKIMRNFHGSWFLAMELPRSVT